MTLIRTRAGVLAATGATVAGLLALLGPAAAQEAPAPKAPVEANEAVSGGPPPGFGQTVSAAAQRGPEYPSECGNFGRWVSAQARGVACTPPPTDEATP